MGSLIRGLVIFAVISIVSSESFTDKIYNLQEKVLDYVRVVNPFRAQASTETRRPIEQATSQSGTSYSGNGQQYEQNLYNNNQAVGVKTSSRTSPGTGQRNQISPSSATSSNDAAIEFSWKLLQACSPPDPSGLNDNLVLSPILVQYALTILEKAAADETKTELQRLIGSTNTEFLQKILTENPRSQGGSLELANGIFIDVNQNNLNRSFIANAKNLRSDINSISFNEGKNARDTINLWAAERTHNEIRNLIPDSYRTEGVQMMLLSAIYFKSQWKYFFEPEAQRGSSKFYNDQGRPLNVEFMESRQEIIYDKIRQNDRIVATLIEIPYEGDAHSMVLIVPDTNVTLDNLLQSLTSDDLKTYLNKNLKRSTRVIRLKMPKFVAEQRQSLSEPLQNLGLRTLFSSNAKLPYIGLSDPPQIGSMLQQAVMTVDEKGTTAAAATVTLLIPLSAEPVYDFNFTVNKPFLAMIIDKSSNVPLFMAKIYRPN